MPETMGDYLVVPGFGAGTPNRKKEIAGKLLSRKPEERRKWLENADEALGYYLGPHAGQSVQKLGQLLNFTDVGDYAEVSDASQALWNDPSMANAGRYATAAAAMMVPAVSARMANAGGDVLGDALASGADDVRRFVGDEYGGLSIRQKADEVARLIREKYGVAPDVTYHPTSWGKSAYLKARINGPEGTYVDTGFRLSDHDIGEFRRATDEVGTIIDGEDVTPETLFKTIEDAHTRAMPDLEARAVRRAKTKRDRSMWDRLPDTQKRKYKKRAIKAGMAGGANEGGFVLFQRDLGDTSRANEIEQYLAGLK